MHIAILEMIYDMDSKGQLLYYYYICNTAFRAAFGKDIPHLTHMHSPIEQLYSVPIESIIVAGGVRLT